jgi:lytic murein transglycosylase
LRGDLWPEARSRGISAETFNAAFAKVSPNLNLPGLVIPGRQGTAPERQHQAEFRSPAAYFAHIDGVVSGGRMRAARYAGTLARIADKTGVPSGIVLAVWGRESGFGNAAIPYNAFEVLGTKAFMATRKEMFRRELLAALQMVESGHVAPGEMKSSWAGALGQPQFLPTSFLKYAVDFDGDGRADIWNSQADTLASIANFLAAHGWTRGRDWGFEVTVPDSVSCALEGPDRGKPIAEWVQMGVRRVSGKSFPAHELRGEGYLMMPAGRYGPAFLVTPNFYVLKDYNESDLYALFIGHAADRIMYGDIRFVGRWRSIGDGLDRGDIAALQQRLQRLGYDVGGTDGLVGFKTRRSIGDWQARNGFSATCFPDVETVKAIR